MPVRRQAITQSHPDLLSIAHLGINFSEIRIQKLFIHENAFEYIFCEIAAILSREDELNLFHGPHTFACDCMYMWLTQNVNLVRQEERGTV